MSKQISLSRQEQDFLAVCIEAAKTIKPDRFELIFQLVGKTADNHSVEEFNSAIRHYNLNGHRFSMFLEACHKALSIPAQDFSRMARLNKVMACRAAQAVQGFTEKTLMGDRDRVRTSHLATLDLHMVKIAGMMFIPSPDKTSMQLRALFSFLEHPESLVNEAYPSFIENGMWPAQARVVCGLSQHIHETTSNWSVEEYWRQISGETGG